MKHIYFNNLIFNQLLHLFLFFNANWEWRFANPRLCEQIIAPHRTPLHAGAPRTLCGTLIVSLCSRKLSLPLHMDPLNNPIRSVSSAQSCVAPILSCFTEWLLPNHSVTFYTTTFAHKDMNWRKERGLLSLAWHTPHWTDKSSSFPNTPPPTTSEFT